MQLFSHPRVLKPLISSCFRDAFFAPASQRSYTVLATRTYDDAVGLLNTLQTPFKVLKRRRDAGIRIDEKENEEMRQCLHQIGYTQTDLDKLNIVHVAGTKGKGSTCAYVDSILSQYRKSHDVPSKVGLFTSPHLIAVRERIRINSAPISAELFAKYFFEVWDNLEASPSPLLKPAYFRYLNLMSYHVFLQEKVECGIYEVGIGGEYDSTNIVERPTVTGITTLGIDHTFILGETVEKIAWHKAGIQKREAPSFTVSQVPAAMEVVEKRSIERGVKSFNIVDVDLRLKGVKIKPDAPFQKANASLAIALAETVLEKLDPKFSPNPDRLPQEFIDGLEQVVWRGRCETKVEGNVTWYLDGAHTADSIKVASKWFGDECSNISGCKVLIFNQQGHREAIELLEDLYKAIASENDVKFDQVLFCPTVPRSQGRNGKFTFFLVTFLFPIPAINSESDHVSLATDSEEVASLSLQNAFAAKWKELDPTSNTTIKVLPSVEDVFEYVRGLAGAEGSEVHAFVTGSVHLVGRALGALEGLDAL